VSLKTELRDWLEGALGVNVYPVVFPDDVLLPAVRLQQVDGSPETTHDDTDTQTEKAAFQVSVFARSMADADAIATLLKNSLPYAGLLDSSVVARLSWTRSHDLYEDAARLHHIAIEMDVLANAG